MFAREGMGVFGSKGFSREAIASGQRLEATPLWIGAGGGRGEKQLRSVIIHMPIMTYRDLARFLVSLPDSRRIHESFTFPAL